MSGSQHTDCSVLRVTRDGSPYSRLDRIVEGRFLGPSHYSIGLQCADLVCAITAAAERGGGQARGYLKTLCHGSRRTPRRVRSRASGSSGSRNGHAGRARRTAVLIRTRRETQIEGSHYPEASTSVRQLDEPAHRADESHLLDRLAVGVEQRRGAREHGPALGA